MVKYSKKLQNIVKHSKDYMVQYSFSASPICEICEKKSA